MGRRGSKPGQGGRPRKSLSEKLLDDNLGKRKLTVVEFPYSADLKGIEMPSRREFLSARQKDGRTLEAVEIFAVTWAWLDQRGCAKIVSPQVLERYVMSAAHWIQCETAITEYGFLTKHPTTGSAIQSPYVAMSQNDMAQTNRLWYESFQIVKENCAADYTGVNPQDDVMERLLTARREIVMDEIQAFIRALKHHRLTSQRKTLRGQARAGDLAGAKRGLQRFCSAVANRKAYCAGK